MASEDKENAKTDLLVGHAESENTLSSRTREPKDERMAKNLCSWVQRNFTERSQPEQRQIENALNEIEVILQWLSYLE